MKRTLIASLILSLGLSLGAQNLKVFLNNKPFPGKTAGGAADLYVECQPALKLLGNTTVLDPAATSVEVEGKTLELQNQSGLLMCRAKDLCSVYGGRYDFNKTMGTVDIYAYDPIAKAKEALERILRQKAITSQADFEVMTLVARQYLIQQLGLKLVDDVELKLLTPEEMSKIGGSNLSCLVTYIKGHGSGTGRYIFNVESGNAPLQTFHSLAWAWGVQWQNLNGDESKSDLTHGFGEWVAYALIRDLAKVNWSSQTLRNSTIQPGAKEIFKQLMTIEKQGNIEAVLAYIKNQSKM
ncbi:hypothetical protein JST97_17175 [bacterium]|nr:hypothetical protein [bacterium]